MIDDPLRADQVKLAQRGAQCRQFLNGIGGAVVKQIREEVINRLTALPDGRKLDEERYRLSVALRTIDRFSDTILSAAEQGEEAGVAVQRWLKEQGKEGLFNGFFS